MNSSIAFARFPFGIPARYVVILLLTASTFLAYWSVQEHGFSLYDDRQYVVNNYFIQPGITWENIVWAMTSGFEGNLQPVTWISHMLDYQLFGLNPAGHHLHNVVLHLLSSILLYLLLRRMTGREGPSAFIGMIFALHPLHVESVAWVCQRKDVLSALFGFLTIGAYTSYVASPGFKRYIVVLFCFALGLMSKPIIVTLPFVLLLLDYWPLNRVNPFQPADTRTPSFAFILLEKIPLLLLAVGSSIVTYIVQVQVGAVKAGLSFGARLENVVVSYFMYIKKTFWPFDLAIFYPYPEGGWPAALVVVAGSVLVVLTVLAFVWLKRFPWFAVGWLWYVGTLVPMIGFIQIGAKAYADRYMYWPIVGLSIVVAWCVADIGSGRRRAMYVKSISALLVCLACLALTKKQVGYWENDKTLFERAVRVTEKNWLAHYTLGLYAVQHGDGTNAREHFQLTIAFLPSFPFAYYQLGELLLHEGDAEGSIPYLRHALEQEAEVEKARMHLGIALATVGKSEEALNCFSEAYAANPHYGDPHKNLGFILAGLERFDEAEHYLREALRIEPRDSLLLLDIERVKELKKQ